MKKIFFILFFTVFKLFSQETSTFTEFGMDVNEMDKIEFYQQGKEAIVKSFFKNKKNSEYILKRIDYFTYKGNPIFTDSKGTAATISKDKKTFYFFVFPTSNYYHVLQNAIVCSITKEQAIKEYEELSKKFGLYLDANFTTDFHKKHVNEIVFFNKDLGFNEVAESNVVKSMTTNNSQKIYSRVFVDSSMINVGLIKYWKENPPVSKGKKFLGSVIKTFTGFKTVKEIGALRTSFYPSSFCNVQYVTYVNNKSVDSVSTTLDRNSKAAFTNWTTWREGALFTDKHWKKIFSNLNKTGVNEVKIEAYLDFKGVVFSGENEENETKFRKLLAIGRLYVDSKGSVDVDKFISKKYTEYYKSIQNKKVDDLTFKNVSDVFNFEINSNKTYAINNIVTNNFEYKIYYNDLQNPLWKEKLVFVYVIDKKTSKKYVYPLRFGYNYNGTDYEKTGKFYKNANDSFFVNDLLIKVGEKQFID